MVRDEQYWKGYVAALRWVKGWWSISWDATKALNEKMREINKKHLSIKED